MSWKDNLVESTGQWAFVLSLSKAMIQGLQCIRDGEFEGSYRSHFIRIGHALERRGLIERLPTPEIFNGKTVYKYPPTLTPAGELVCDLLAMAGQLPKRKVRCAAMAA